MYQRGLMQVSWRSATLGILTEFACAGVLVLAAALIALLVNWGVR
ncbi:MAG TPA: hypothetical protein VD902_00640 [Symbiobacteriaceae bacterium]|nr:hypothetical protein [Symbiobacteriaceae bacterium]